MKKLIFFILLLFILSACSRTNVESGRINSDLQLVGDELINFLADELEQNFNISFEVNFVSKEPVRLSTWQMIDGSGIANTRIEGGYWHTFEIIDADGVVASLEYRDPIIVALRTGGIDYRESFFRETYERERTRYDRRIQIHDVFKEGNVEWDIGEQVQVSDSGSFTSTADFFIVLYSTDSETVCNIIQKLDEIFKASQNTYANNYTLYIVSDRSLFEAIKENPGYTWNEERERQILLFGNHYVMESLASQRMFSREVFDEHIFLDGEFEYVFFRYRAERNSILSNSQNFTVFGLIPE